jgi:hypothetical protein
MSPRPKRTGLSAAHKFGWRVSRGFVKDVENRLQAMHTWWLSGMSWI